MWNQQLYYNNIMYYRQLLVNYNVNHLPNDCHISTRETMQLSELYRYYYQVFNSPYHQQSYQVDTRLFRQTNLENYKTHEKLSDV